MRRRCSDSIPGRIAAATINPRKSRAMTILIFHRASAPTMIARATRVVTAVFRAVAPMARGLWPSGESCKPNVERAGGANRRPCEAAWDRSCATVGARRGCGGRRGCVSRGGVAVLSGGGGALGRRGRCGYGGRLAVGSDAGGADDREAVRGARRRAAASGGGAARASRRGRDGAGAARAIARIRDGLCRRPRDLVRRRTAWTRRAAVALKPGSDPGTWLEQPCP